MYFLFLIKENSCLLYMSTEVKTRQDSEVYYGVGSFLFEIIKVFLLAVVIILPVRIFLFQPFFVKGASMEPNFFEGDYLIVNEWGYKTTSINPLGFETGLSVSPFKELERSTVVVVRSPESSRSNATYFIKRVIGLPGETVKIDNGRVRIINKKYPEGFLLDESTYLNPAVKTNGTGMTLKDDEYFVMGDNRGNSSDSRSWGALKKDHVIGKVAVRILPVQRFHFFPNADLTHAVMGLSH